jgi:hypothetical protein
VKPLDLVTLTPCRAVDTRSADAPALAGGSTRPFMLAGHCGVPAGAKAVAANVAVVQPQAAGYLQIYPGDLTTPPLTATVNFAAGAVRANNAVLVLAADGTGIVKAFAGTSGSLDLVVDVVGYFE